MNAITAFMITPKSVMDLYDIDEYYLACEIPYKESITRNAEYHGLDIGEIERKDLGLCSKEKIAQLNRQLGHSHANDCESYVVMFRADVLTEPSQAIGAAVG